MEHPNRSDTKTGIKIDHTCKLRIACNIIALTDRIKLLKIETE